MLALELLALALTRPIWPRTTRSGLVNGLWFHQSRTPPQIDPDDVAEMLESHQPHLPDPQRIAELIRDQ